MFLILKGGTGVCICLESIINSTTKEYTTEWEAIAYKTTKCLSRGELRFSAPHLMPEARTAAYSGGLQNYPPASKADRHCKDDNQVIFFINVLIM